MSREWKNASEEAQAAQRKMTVFPLSNPAFGSYLAWFSRWACGLESLALDCSSPSTFFLAQADDDKVDSFLAIAATKAERLQHLYILQPREQWHQSLVGLTQLKTLRISKWCIPWPGGCESQRGCLLCLKSLQVSKRSHLHIGKVKWLPRAYF